MADDSAALVASELQGVVKVCRCRMGLASRSHPGPDSPGARVCSRSVAHLVRERQATQVPDGNSGAGCQLQSSKSKCREKSSSGSGSMWHVAGQLITCQTSHRRGPTWLELGGNSTVLEPQPFAQDRDIQTRPCTHLDSLSWHLCACGSERRLNISVAGSFSWIPCRRHKSSQKDTVISGLNTYRKASHGLWTMAFEAPARVDASGLALCGTCLLCNLSAGRGRPERFQVLSRARGRFLTLRVNGCSWQ